MEENKYVLILGAGLMQRPAIEAAKDLGYRTFVVDANADAVCVQFADVFEQIDLKDKEKIAQRAKEFGPELKAVFTCGTDFSASVSYVAEACGLKSHNYEAAVKASNKIKMRQCFRENNIPSPDFAEISRMQIASYLLPEKLNSLTFPKVIKPVDNMGARGCRLIRNLSEFIPSVEEAVRCSRTEKAILEDYMEGPEFSIDALVYENTITITGFADRHIFYQPYFIEMGHTMPTQIEESKKLELIECFAKAVQALGLTHGAAKADIKYTENGPMIGEIAARLSGGYMSGWTYPYSSDLNLTKQALLIALGKVPQELMLKRKPLPVKSSGLGIYEIPCNKTSAERAYISIPGKVQKIYGDEKINAVPYIKNYLPRVKPEDSVDFPRNNVEKCGNIITVSADYSNAVESAQKACSTIFLRLEKNNPATENFLYKPSKSSENNFPPPAFSLQENENAAFENYFDSMKIIPENEKITARLSVKLKEIAMKYKDWNHRNLYEAFELYDKICCNHPELDAVKFWTLMKKGSIQAAVYYTDSLN